MLARTNRNGLIIPHGADGLAWTKTVRDTPSEKDWIVRATASGIAVCPLPICCQNGAGGTFNELETLSNSFNTVYDVGQGNNTEGFYCTWTISTGSGTFPTITGSASVDGLSCGAGSISSFAGGAIQIFYCRTTGHVAAKLVLTIGTTAGIVFYGTSAADPCFPLTIDNALTSYDCGSCTPAGFTCNGHAYGNTDPAWAYGGSMTLELVCPP